MKRRAFAGSVLLLWLFCAITAWSSAPEPPDRRERRALREHEEARGKRALIRERRVEREAAGIPGHSEGFSRGVDVLSYDLSFTLDPAVRHLAGRAVIRLAGVLPATSAIALDLDDAFTVSETSRDGRPLVALSRSGGHLVLPLEPPLHAEERTTLEISYAGVPPSYGALAFWRPAAGAAATSVAEPFDAPTFWPCVDDPADRAVVTVRATVPAGYEVASAGLVEKEPAQDGKQTFVWRLPQKISSYLVSLNAAPYATITGRYVSRDGTKEMPLASYVLPEHEALARPRVAAIPGHIAALASLFGEFPFLDTKYGIVESSFSGGMEHPTMTSIGTAQLSSSRDLTTLFVHELAHQWWGDRVTMKTWDDLWLNEGFATYSEVLYLEKAQGLVPGRLLQSAYDDGLYAGALAFPVVASPSDPFRHSGSVYDKGAWALHMLRRSVGDDVFFRALRAYGDSNAFGNVTRADLRETFEKESGRDLKFFFDQWVETPFRPVLRATFKNALDLATVGVTLTQVQSHTVVHPAAAPSDVAWYRFPVKVRLDLADGTHEDHAVSLDTATTSVDLPNPSRKRVATMEVDPDGDLLAVVESVAEVM